MANEQGRLLPEGRFERLDITHSAEEIEDVAKSEQRELTRRTSLLVSRLVAWLVQPGRRGACREVTIRNQRRGVERRPNETPSRRPSFEGPSVVWAGVWEDATA